jgi:hypothetical protein
VGFGYVVEVDWVVLVVCLFEWRLMPLLLLVKDLDAALKLYEPCSFSVHVLPSGCDMLSCCLPSCDIFLFLMEPLDLLLNSS